MDKARVDFPDEIVKCPNEMSLEEDAKDMAKITYRAIKANLTIYYKNSETVRTEWIRRDLEPTNKQLNAEDYQLFALYYHNELRRLKHIDDEKIRKENEDSCKNFNY